LAILAPESCFLSYSCIIIEPGGRCRPPQEHGYDAAPSTPQLTPLRGLRAPSCFGRWQCMWLPHDPVTGAVIEDVSGTRGASLATRPTLTAQISLSTRLPRRSVGVAGGRVRVLRAARFFFLTRTGCDPRQRRVGGMGADSLRQRPTARRQLALEHADSLLPFPALGYTAFILQSLDSGAHVVSISDVTADPRYFTSRARPWHVHHLSPHLEGEGVGLSERARPS